MVKTNTRAVSARSTDTLQTRIVRALTECYQAIEAGDVRPTRSECMAVAATLESIGAHALAREYLALADRLLVLSADE